MPNALYASPPRSTRTTAVKLESPSVNPISFPRSAGSARSASSVTAAT